MWVFIFLNEWDCARQWARENLLSFQVPSTQLCWEEKQQMVNVLLTSLAAQLFLETLQLDRLVWNLLAAVGDNMFKFRWSFNTCLLNLFKRQPPGQYSGKQYTRKTGGWRIGELDSSSSFYYYIIIMFLRLLRLYMYYYYWFVHSATTFWSICYASDVVL